MNAIAPPQPTRARHRLVAFTLALVAVAYLDRVCISTAAPAIKADLALRDSEMGLVFSAFTLAYALFEVPSGWRRAFAVFGSVGLLWAAAWWRWFRDDPAEHPAMNAGELDEIRAGGAEHRPRGDVPWHALARNSSFVALCAMYGAAIYGWYF